MDLQNTFYLFTIILMMMGIIFLFGCIAFLTYLFLTFRNAKNQLGRTVDNLIEESRKKTGIAGFGLYLLSALLRKLKTSSSEK